MTSNKETLEMLNEFGTTGYDAMRQFGDIGLRTWEKLAEQQMNTVTQLMETGLQNMKLASEAQDYQEALKGQLELGRKLGEDLMGQTRQSFDIAHQAREDYRAWFENGLALAGKQFNKVAEQAA